MLRYFFVKKRDPFTDTATEDYFSHIIDLSQQGNQVSVFLIQNGITPAVKTAAASRFDELLTKPITVYVDAASLEQRGIEESELKPNIKMAELHAIVDAVLSGAEVIWS